MPYVPLPAKPTAGQTWTAVGDAWYDNVAQLIVDVPALRADVTATQSTAAALASAKAPTHNPTFTGTVSGVTKAMVGLGDVDNTADAGKIFDAGQVVGGFLNPARLPVAVAAIRTRTPVNEAAPTATNWEARPSGYPIVLAVGALPQPSDRQASDLHVLPATTEAGGTSFTLPDGSSWPAPWVTAKMPAGGQINVQGYEGRIVTGNTVGNYQSEDAAAVRHSTQAANLDILFTTRRVTGGVTPVFVLRCDRDDLDPQEGLAVTLNGSTLKIVQIANWIYTDIASVAKSWSTGADYRVRISAQGTSVRAKQWPAAGAEPAGWDVIGTVTRTASGHFGFSVGPGASAQSYTAAFDNITVSL